MGYVICAMYLGVCVCASQLQVFTHAHTLTNLSMKVKKCAHTNVKVEKYIVPNHLTKPPSKRGYDLIVTALLRMSWWNLAHM